VREFISDAPDGASVHDMSTVTKDTQEARVYFEGDAHSPSLVEVRASPDKPATAHAHETDEIVYVLEGELVIGRRVFGPESAVFIPANTLYSFRVGPEGVRYLNMRTRRDDSYITRDELVARRGIE
jgi:hypothetical protein